VARLLIVERKHLIEDEGSVADERAPLLNGSGVDLNNAACTNSATQSTPRGCQDGSSNFVQLFRSKPLLILLGMCVIAGIVLTDIEPTLPLWLEHIYHLDPFQIGLVFLTLMVPNIAFGPLVGYLVDQYSAQPLITFGVVMTAMAQLLPGYVMRTTDGQPVLAWTCLSLFVYSSALNFCLDPLAPEIANCVPRGAYSKAYSLFNMAWSLGIMIGVRNSTDPRVVCACVLLNLFVSFNCTHISFFDVCIAYYWCSYL
jgi:MFS family permease